MSLTSIKLFWKKKKLCFGDASCWDISHQVNIHIHQHCLVSTVSLKQHDAGERVHLLDEEGTLFTDIH